MDSIWLGVLSLFLNVVLVVGGGVVSFFLRGMRDDVEALQKADGLMAAKVASIEVMVAGTYVTRGEFQTTVDKLGNALFSKLDRIETKVDQKADK